MAALQCLLLQCLCWWPLVAVVPFLVLHEPCLGYSLLQAGDSNIAFLLPLFERAGFSNANYWYRTASADTHPIAKPLVHEAQRLAAGVCTVTVCKGGGCIRCLGGPCSRCGHRKGGGVFIFVCQAPFSAVAKPWSITRAAIFLLTFCSCPLLFERISGCCLCHLALRSPCPPPNRDSSD